MIVSNLGHSVKNLVSVVSCLSGSVNPLPVCIGCASRLTVHLPRITLRLSKRHASRKMFGSNVCLPRRQGGGGHEIFPLPSLHVYVMGVFTDSHVEPETSLRGGCGEAFVVNGGSRVITGDIGMDSLWSWICYSCSRDSSVPLVLGNRLAANEEANPRKAERCGRKHASSFLLPRITLLSSTARMFSFNAASRYEEMRLGSTEFVSENLDAVM
jgi:hypothetical protein